MKTWVCLFLCFHLCTSAWAAPFTPAATIRQTDAGLVEGVTNHDVLSFRGIPYAAPPIGELRWQPAQPHTPWQGVLKTQSFGHDCMQEPMRGDAATSRAGFSEDCLYLNLWRPAQKQPHLLPVMVWIYGGGFVNGGSSPQIYSGRNFAKHGTLLVSFNYRLGRFGFFAFPALTTSQKNSITGNYAYTDMLSALVWIQRNIEAFGGDPNNVTLFGESAGGFAIHTLMASPLAHGLFHKAIIQSGGGRIDEEDYRRVSQPGVNGIASAESTGIAFAEKHGIQGTDAKALAQLRALPAGELAKGLNMASDDPTFSGPMIDGKLVTDNPAHLYEIGTGIDVPLIVGATDEDIGLPPPTHNEHQALKSFGHERFAEAMAAYNPYGELDHEDLADRVATDQLMLEPARFTARMAEKQGKAAYSYRFSYVADAIRENQSGATHASEIPYVFDQLDAMYPGKVTDKDRRVAHQMQHYWIQFAKTGNPNSKHQPHWPSYHARTDEILIISAKGAKQTHAEKDPWKKRLDMAESVAAQY